MKISKALMLAIEWRAIAFAIDTTVAFLFTRRFDISLGFATVASIIKFLVNTYWLKNRTGGKIPN